MGLATVCQIHSVSSWQRLVTSECILRIPHNDQNQNKNPSLLWRHFKITFKSMWISLPSLFWVRIFHGSMHAHKIHQVKLSWCVIIVTLADIDVTCQIWVAAVSHHTWCFSRKRCLFSTQWIIFFFLFWNWSCPIRFLIKTPVPPSLTNTIRLTCLIKVHQLQTFAPQLISLYNNSLKQYESWTFYNWYNTMFVKKKKKTRQCHVRTT